MLQNTSLFRHCCLVIMAYCPALPLHNHMAGAVSPPMHQILVELCTDYCVITSKVLKVSHAEPAQGGLNGIGAVLSAAFVATFTSGYGSGLYAYSPAWPEVLQLQILCNCLFR